MLLKLSKFFLYISVFCVIVVLPSTFFPFIGGKYYVFRAFVELAAVFAVLYWAFEAAPNELESRLKVVSRRPLFVAVSVFVIAYLLAAIFAYDPHAAFWSNFERGEGAFQMTHYYLFFVLLILFFKERKEWHRILKLSLVAAVLMILYGVFAQVGWSDRFIGPKFSSDTSVSFWKKLAGPRFQGSLGNPSYVAPYLMFSIFYALYLWANEVWKKQWLKRAVYGALIIFFFFFFALSQTRGAFLGLYTAVIIFLIYLSFISRSKRAWVVGALIGVVVATGAAASFRHTEFIKNMPVGRFFDVFDLGLNTDTVQTRLWTWGSAWQGFKDRPILGWGPENFSTVFDKYFDTRHFSPLIATETWFDRAHSVVFDYLAETGIIGLLSYISIFIALFWQLLKKRNPSEVDNTESVTSVTRGLAVAITVGYLIQALALFDVLPIYLNLFLFLAFCSFLFLNNSHAKR